MHGEDFFFQARVFLAAAVVSVPIAKRLGLGSVLGYLIAGMVIGPFGLGLVGDESRDVLHFAEFGVVMMLFLVGLELQPSLLWRMRGPILGLGGLQVCVTALALGVFRGEADADGWVGLVASVADGPGCDGLFGGASRRFRGSERLVLAGRAAARSRRDAAMGGRSSRGSAGARGIDATGMGRAGADLCALEGAGRLVWMGRKAAAGCGCSSQSESSASAPVAFDFAAPSAWSGSEST